MIKRIPYEQYQLSAVEDWLNDRAGEGLRLEGLMGPYARFAESPVREYYRVRYLPDGAVGDGLLNWGSLYVYRAGSPEQLPPETHAADSLVASEKVAVPSIMDLIIFVLSMVILWYMVYRVFIDHYFLAAIGAAIAFVGILVHTWHWRKCAREMASTGGQAQVKPNTVSTAVYMVSILIFVVLLAAQFVVNKL